jgi:hypothetical protein
MPNANILPPIAEGIPQRFAETIGDLVPGAAGVVVLSKTEARRLAAFKLAASTGLARPILTGVSFEVTADGITAAATDSYRLAVRDYPGGVVGDGTAHVFEPGAMQLIPAKELADALEAAGKLVTRNLEELFRVAVIVPGEPDRGVTVTVLLRDGENPGAGYTRTIAPIVGSFPDWKRLIPMALGVSDLHQIPGHAPTGADGELLEEGERLPDTGEVFAPAAAVAAWNPDYLADLARLTGATRRDRDVPVRLTYTGPRKPSLFEVPESGSRSRLRYLLMPVRL